MYMFLRAYVFAHVVDITHCRNGWTMAAVLIIAQSKMTYI